MKTASLFLLSLLFISSLLFAQEKPQTIVVPTGSIGKIKKSRVLILEKALESKLDDYFSIVPEQNFEAAKEHVFQALTSDMLTEDKIIMMIMEFLDVENAFRMALIYEEGDTQISLTWNDQDEKRIAEDYCEDCKTKELRKMIGGLVENLVGGLVKK
jgi:hypothetical protein